VSGRKSWEPGAPVNWFRCHNDFDLDPRIVEIGHYGTGVWFHILAMMKRVKSENGSMLISDSSLCHAAGRKRRDYAEQEVRKLEASGLLTLTKVGAMWKITVRKWSNWNGKVEATETETETETKTENTKRDPEPSAEASGPSKPKPKAKARSATLCPPQPTEEQKQRLIEWGKGRPEQFNVPQMKNAWEVVYDWSKAGGNKRVDWEATVRNAMRPNERGEIWGLKGYSGPFKSPKDIQAAREIAADKKRWEEQQRLEAERGHE